MKRRERSGIGQIPDRRAFTASSADGATVFALAANIPAEESQLEVLPAEVLTGRLAAGHAAAYHGAVDQSQQHDDFWKWFAVACVACILGEMSTLLIFRT